MGGLLKGPDPSGAVYWAPDLLVGVPRRVAGLAAVLQSPFVGSSPSRWGVSWSGRGWTSFSGSQGSLDWERICLDLFWGGSSGSGALQPSLCGSKSPWEELGGT